MRLWARHEDDELRKLCADEALSYGSIAAQLSRRLHRKVTRSAVGQRARRLGLRIHTPRRDGPPDLDDCDHEPERWTPPEDHVPVFRARLDFPDPEPHATGMLLLNAGMRDCRWPVKGTGVAMRVCGEPVQAGSAYCGHCHRLAYQKPADEPRGPFKLMDVDHLRRVQAKRRQRAGETA
jgi:hypothetical protein